MRLVLLFSFFLFSVNCSKPKSVFICGDHVCINKAEAEQYFEENLSLEVKIVDLKKKGKIDLVKLNLKENSHNNRKITIETKTKTNNPIKVLTNDEIKKVKKEIKNKKKRKKIAKTITEDKNKNKKKLPYELKKTKKIIKDSKKNTINSKKSSVDVCTLIKKCNIEEISKFLLKQGKKKNFPDITTRE
jgi:hypothetical protein